MCIRMCVCVCLYIGLYIYVCVCVYVYICVCVCECVCGNSVSDFEVQKLISLPEFVRMRYVMAVSNRVFETPHIRK